MASKMPAQRGFAMAAAVITRPDFLPMFNSYRMLARPDTGVHHLAKFMSEVGKAVGDADLAASQLELRRGEQDVHRTFERFTPEHWPTGFAALLNKRKAVQWFEGVIAVGQSTLRQHPVDEALASRPLSLASQAAFRRARQHLALAPVVDARWWAVATFP